MKEKRNIKLKIAHSDFAQGQEFVAEYNPLTDTYEAKGKHNNMVTLNGAWCEEVFDVNFEENYEKEIAEINNEYQKSIGLALERFKKAKTAHLLLDQTAKAERVAQEKLDSEKKAEEQKLADEIAEKEAEQKRIEEENSANQIALQAKAVTEAKQKVEQDIEQKKVEVAAKESEVEKLERELALYENKLDTDLDAETKQMKEELISKLAETKSNLEVSKSALDITTKQLENIDVVSLKKK